MDPLSSPTVRRFVAESPIDRRLIAGWVLRASKDAPRGSRVLDAGAGEAPYAELFSHCAYTTSDWAQSVHPGAARADIVAPLTALGVQAGSFDVIVCTQVLEHVAAPGDALAELFRVLAPGGRLWLTVPFVGELHEEPHDFFRYTRHGLAELCGQAGFEQLEIEPLGGYFSALAQMARNCGVATGVQARERTAARVIAAGLRVLGNRLPRLDRLDRRFAWPLGYGVRAVRPASASARS